MSLKNGLIISVIFLTIASAYFVLNSQIEEHKETLPEQINGPAIILFKGDNSANCLKIDRLVEQAKSKYKGRIHVSLFDWSDDNPLIKKYKIRFLPSVIFINSKGKEAGRIVGESPAVQKKLSEALNQAEHLLSN
ncbi:MAG: thioredoxin 1 [Thiomicrorhabdus sp.]|nr:MAG: thioredoxin 1 [Thiomicrorhabdus sp.]